MQIEYLRSFEMGFFLKIRRTIETIEYSMDSLAKTVDLHPKRFCLVAALLGNHILAEEELFGSFINKYIHVLVYIVSAMLVPLLLHGAVQNACSGLLTTRRTPICAK